MLRHLPNALTILRLGLAVAFPWIPAGWRLGVLLTALLTEVLDGALARAFHWESRFGRVLDPVADRALFLSVALSLVADGSLEWTGLAMLGARDALVALGALWVTVRGHMWVLSRLRPRAAGKTTTALQYVAVSCALLGIAPPALILVATLLIGLLGAVQYGADYRRERSAIERVPV